MKYTTIFGSAIGRNIVPETIGKGKRVSNRDPHAPRGRPNTLLTDDQVIACRIAHEQGGVKSHVLAKQYGTSLEYMRLLLSYRTRSKLFPPIAALTGSDGSAATGRPG